MTSYAQGFAPQQPQQQPRQGFGQQMQSMFGGYQPSRQSFGQQQGGFGGFGGFGMPQQFGGFGGFGGYGMPQQRFGGFGGYGMPQQQQGFGNIFARTMPPQQQGFGGGFSPESITSFPAAPPRQQDLGGSLGSFFGRQGFNMPQRPMTYPMAPQQQQANQMMQPSGGRMVGPDPIMQQQQAQEREQLRQQGITPIDPNDPTLAAAAQRNRQLDLENQANYGQKQRMQPPQAQMNQPPASVQDLASLLRGGSQSAAPSSPYTQQIGQEDPRMQAMRNMQRMRFGGPEGYTF